MSYKYLRGKSENNRRPSSLSEIFNYIHKETSWCTVQRTVRNSINIIKYPSYNCQEKRGDNNNPIVRVIVVRILEICLTSRALRKILVDPL